MEPTATKPAATHRTAAVAGVASFAELNRIDLSDLRWQMDAGLPLGQEKGSGVDSGGRKRDGSAP